jgi:hypothetical protein
MAADELRRQADVFMELEQLIPEISRAGNRRTAAPAGEKPAADTRREVAAPNSEPYADDGYDDYDDEDDYDDGESQTA